MEIPKNVTVMIDAGAVVKLRQANIEVGSTEVNIDRSGGALQILGTPQQLVCLTSYQDSTIGYNDNPLATAAYPPEPGDWGGLVFESDLDNAYNAANPANPRTDYEQEGIFLNYVNHADISYGGGSLLVNSVRTVFDPIYLTDTRITASYNTISKRPMPPCRPIPTPSKIRYSRATRASGQARSTRPTTTARAPCWTPICW